jgi:hypothetical protein
MGTGGAGVCRWLGWLVCSPRPNVYNPLLNTGMFVRAVFLRSE